MSNETIMIQIFFIILASLVLWFIIGAKGSWWIKSTVIIIVPSLCFWVWMSLGALMGWPIDRVPDGGYDIIWGNIQEPNKSKGIKGSIYIWIKNIDEDSKYDMFDQEEKHKMHREPRSYRLPYTRDMHKQMEQIKQALKGGARVRALIKGKKGEKSGGPEADPDIQFYLLPDPQINKSDPSSPPLDLRDGSQKG